MFGYGNYPDIIGYNGSRIPIQPDSPYKKIIEGERLGMPTGRPTFPGQNPTLEAPEVEEVRPENGLMTAYRELLNRQDGPSMSSYRKFLEKGYPKEEDYKPSGMRRLGAVLSAGLSSYANPNDVGGAIKTATDMKERPYRRAVAQYGMEGERLKEAAAIEEGSYRSKIAAAQAIGTLQNQQADNDRADRAAQVAEANTRSLITSRNLTMEETKKRIEQMGERWQENKITGVLELVSRDGTITPIGKFDKSSGEKTTDDKEMKEFESRLSQNRQIAVRKSPTNVDTRNTPVSATQQVAATKAAANKVLNQSKFKKLFDSGVITIGETGYGINRTAEGGYGWTGGAARNKAQREAEELLITEFEKLVEEEKQRIMNTTINRSGGDTSSPYEPVE